MMNRFFWILSIAFLCLTMLSIVIAPLAQQGEYDPWLDSNDDGLINIVDIARLAKVFGTEGVPINKTAFLDLQNLYDELRVEHDRYVSGHTHTDPEYNSLYMTYTNMKAPKVVRAWDASDIRPEFGSPYLWLYGYAVNVGSDTAFNCSLHVVANRGSEEAVIDTYVNLGTIVGELKSTYMDNKFTYSGNALTDWTITPEWTT